MHLPQVKEGRSRSGPPWPAMCRSGCRCARLASPAAGEAEGPLPTIVLRASPLRGCLGGASGGETARGAHRAIGVRMSAGHRAWAMAGEGSRKREEGTVVRGVGTLFVSRGGGWGQEGACAPIEMHRQAGSRCVPQRLRPWCRDRRKHELRMRALQDAGFVPGHGTCTKNIGCLTKYTKHSAH